MRDGRVVYQLLRESAFLPSKHATKANAPSQTADRHTVIIINKHQNAVHRYRPFATKYVVYSYMLYAAAICCSNKKFIFVFDMLCAAAAFPKTVLSASALFVNFLGRRSAATRCAHNFANVYITHRDAARVPYLVE